MKSEKCKIQFVVHVSFTAVEGKQQHVMFNTYDVDIHVNTAPLNPNKHIILLTVSCCTETQNKSTYDPFLPN